jgi:uncharacterized protein involved in exopolysaccharide biosynthesis
MAVRDQSAGSRTWFEDEPPLGGAMSYALHRLVRRALASWPVWVGAALLLAVGTAAWRVHRPPVYEVTVVLRVIEGGVQSSGAEIGPGMLRAHVNELAFTRARLLDLARRHPEAFKGLGGDPSGTLEQLRGRMKVSITQNDFLEDRAANDPPRSATIAIAYSAPNPDVAWAVSHDLAELVIDSTRSGQRAALERLEAGSNSALGQAEARLDVEQDGPLVDRGAAKRVLKRAVEQRAAVQLSLRAAEEQQTLRFELVDPGVLPAPPTLVSRVSSFVATLVVLLLSACLIAGAFDPRVLDLEDLGALGIVPLGRLPALPPAGERSRPKDGGAGDVSSPRV